MDAGVVRDRARVAFVAYAVALAVVLLNPVATLGSSAVTLMSDVAGSAGLPAWLVRWDRMEVLLNIAALVPLSAIGMLAWPRLGWQDWTAYGFVLSVLVEAAQALVFALRSATFVDVVANTAGACIGALSVVVCRRAVSARRRS